MRTVRLVLGSIIVYIVVACSSAATDNPGGLFGGSPSQDASAGPGGAILDALTDPITTAQADTSQSGSRLKAKYVAGVDGSKQFNGLHDSQRNEDCSFGTAADGVLRCLPGGANTTLGLFADAACTQPLAETSKGCAPSAYATTTDITVGACNTMAHEHVFMLGSAFTGTTVYSKGPTTCAPYAGTGANPFTTSFDFYSVGSEVPASSFVQGSLQTEP